MPQSENSCSRGPLREKKLLSGLRKLDEPISTTTSMWAALMHKQLDMTSNAVFVFEGEKLFNVNQVCYTFSSV